MPGRPKPRGCWCTGGGDAEPQGGSSPGTFLPSRCGPEAQHRALGSCRGRSAHHPRVCEPHPAPTAPSSCSGPAPAGGPGDQAPAPPPRPWATWPLPEADTTAVGAQKPRPQVWSPCTPPSAWPGQVGSRTSPPGPLGWESHGALGWPGSGLPRSHSLRARAGDPSGGAQCGGVPVWGPRASGNSHRMRGTKASRPHRAAVSNSSSSAVALGRAGSPQRTLCVHSPAWGAP